MTMSDLVFRVDGLEVSVPDDGASLAEVLRDRLGHRSVKDGCSPQGQCGCCTVLVDGAPRISCVTPVRRVKGRAVTTLDGLDDEAREKWGDAFCATGGSQCGFCTPGIILRFEGLRAKAVEPDDAGALDRALRAHLCRCTGWQTIREAYAGFGVLGPTGERDFGAAARRAALEGHAPQAVGPEVALGRGGFADDRAPDDALVAVLDTQGGWVVGQTLSEARALAGKVQGRRTTVEGGPPLVVPDGDWVRTLRTHWVEPAYLETDASWCEPGGEPAAVLANGGAFGGKVGSELGATARRLADEHGRAVRVRLAREDTTRFGPKRPPVAGGIRADGTGLLRLAVGATGIPSWGQGEAAASGSLAEAVRAVAPGLVVDEVEVPGPPTSGAIRGAGWVEAAVLASAGAEPGVVVAPNGARAEASVDPSGLRVSLSCGDPLDEVVLRSYCIGAAHMALSWVTSESLTVDETGEVLDLTIRSFGVLAASDTPPVEVEIERSEAEPVNGSDAVFAAVTSAVWAALDFPEVWPAGRLPW